MRAPDEYDLELSHELECRLVRDDERERFDQRRQRTIRRPRYSRFRTLARIAANLETCAMAEQTALANTGKRAA